MLKRAFDVLASVLGLLALSPVFVAVSLAVWLQDRGPVFFRQERVGRNGEMFKIHKFRSMRVSNAGSLVTSAHDDRITPVGRFLRASKLDELPQLIDVLEGTMSIVGPRPEVQRYVDLWEPGARNEILSVRPGISDPAAIAYRNEQEELAESSDPERHYVEVILPRKVAMYREYVRHQSFIGDLRLIFQTLAAVVKG
ncbi:sugar transferase [Tessaracoccus aquimaris]|uniref:Sugar transferase n=1 Tax=Tessaracoccus aquimaris TaxID=1332264 RepID=A0A1Q2CS15_9ACTN|nr:sugar transferase [Tessaracoccus aquimaris]AQP48800.1 sugar transferase [Tessaracoccus aquimaris]